MCRIAGVINSSLPVVQLRMIVQSMCHILEHGGPDDEGLYENQDCHLVLGNRRLSIIDMSAGGHQPMLYDDDRYVITYNGELYNYKALKKELTTAGCVFKTQSDTEVIIAAYVKWGTAALERFNGMFAFVIWDSYNKQLLIARDPSGIKPVYYSFTKDGFAFASEVKALKAVPWLQEKNQHWPIYFMAYGHLPEPVTTLKNVVPLEKGNYLVYNVVDQTLKIKSFSRYTYMEKISNRSDAVELIKYGLEKAVKQHLVSDAPIGVFLSGGLDSGIIAAIASQHLANLKTISIYFDDNEYSEKTYQDKLLKRLHCDNEQILIKENDFHSFLPGIIQSMDLPSCDGINTWFTSKYAKGSDLKAVLSGVGGDELFGGYPSFKRINTVLALEKLPDSILKAGRFATSKRIRRFPYLSMGGVVGRYLFLRGQFIPADIASFFNADESEIWNLLAEQPQLPEVDYLTAANQASWMETNLYMQNQLLRDSDVMSMAHGLEIRLPFLDKEFIAAVLKIKSEVKYNGRLGKQLLIDSFKDILPEIIWNRPKMGFSFPFKEWLSNERYAITKKGKDLSSYHSKLKSDKMHWSQFFILYLMNEYIGG